MALGHEQGHALLNMLPKELSEYLRSQVENTYGPEAIQATSDYYNKSLALSFPKDGISFTEADFIGNSLKPDLPIEKLARFEEITQNTDPIAEIIAENLGAIQRSDQLPISKKNLTEKVSDLFKKDEVSYTKLGIAESPLIQEMIRRVYEGVKGGDIELKAPIKQAPPKPVEPPKPDLSKVKMPKSILRIDPNAPVKEPVTPPEAKVPETTGKVDTSEMVAEPPKPSLAGVKMPKNILRIDPNAPVKEPVVSPPPVSPETSGTVDLSSFKLQQPKTEPIADYSDAISAAKKLRIPHKQIKQGIEAAIAAGVTSSEEALRLILNPSKTPIESVSQPKLKLTPTTPERPIITEPGANIRVKGEDVTPFEKKSEAETPKTPEKLEEGLPFGNETPPDYHGLRIRRSRVLPGDVTQTGEPRKTRQAVVGDRLFSDPVNPTPKEQDIYTKAVETPEKQANLKAFEDLIENQNNADITYSSAERFKEGEIPTNKERGEEFEAEGTGQTGRQVVQKNVQPTNIKVIQNKEGGYSVFLEGHSPDKAIANANLVFNWVKENPGKVELPLKSIKDVAQWLNKYYENQNHNYRGDGSILLDKDRKALVEPDPNFEPHEISDDVVQFLNLIQGGEGNNYADVALINGRKLISMEPNAAVRKANEMMEKAKTDRGRKTAQELMVKGLSAGEIPVVDINPLRRQLNEAGFQVRDSKGTAEILSPTFETLRLDRVQKVQDTGKLELKPGKSIFQKAGFMPEVKKPESYGKEEAIKKGYTIEAYHGTHAKPFNVFDKSVGVQSGGLFHFGSEESAKKRQETAQMEADTGGTPDPDIYGERADRLTKKYFRIDKFYLKPGKIKKVKDVNSGKNWSELAEKYPDIDTFIYENKFEGGTSYAVRNPEQIKIAKETKVPLEDRFNLSKKDVRFMPKSLNQIPVNKPIKIPLLTSQDNEELKKVKLK